jgi:NADH:ubiquinone oxidoreductase subunit 4 (subunit M)
LRQLDLKRIVAYSSIAHMNFSLLGLFSGTYEGCTGALVVFIGHALVSGAMFFLVGVLYDRYKSRLSFYYSGLVMRMPVFSCFFLFFSLSNIAFPGTANFLGEVLILCGLVPGFFITFLLAGVLTFIGTIYTLWLYNRTTFGTVKTHLLFSLYDLTRRETSILFFFFVPTLVLGFYPELVLDVLSLPILFSLSFSF